MQMRSAPYPGRRLNATRLGPPYIQAVNFSFPGVSIQGSNSRAGSATAEAPTEQWPLAPAPEPRRSSARRRSCPRIFVLLDKDGDCILRSGSTGERVVLRTALCLLAVGLGLTAKTSLAAVETFQWLQLGPTGLEARVITEEPSCPTLQLDNAQKLMGVRASSDDKFPIRVCSAAIPPDAHSVAIAGASLALPPATELQRVAVIGDTGCRLKGDYIQACNDPTQWPPRSRGDCASETRSRDPRRRLLLSRDSLSGDCHGLRRKPVRR